MKYNKLALSFIIIMILSLGGVVATVTYAKLSSSHTSQMLSNRTPPSMPNNNQSYNSHHTTKNKMTSHARGLDSMQVLIIGECLFVFSASSLMLIAIKGGRKSIKEAFNKSYKVIIVVISTMLLTGALTCMCKYLFLKLSSVTITG